MEMDNKAIGIVANYYIDKHPKESFEVFIVWKCKALQNWKYLISTTLSDDIYFELTYNGDKQEWYLDCYKKIENRVIKDC